MTIPKHLRRHLAQALAIMAITTASGSGTTLLSPLLREQGKDPVAIGALVGVPAIVSLLIRIPGGLLYSQRRARPLLGLAVCLGALGFVLYPVTTDALVLVFVGAIYGVGYSIATTVSMALAIESLRPGDNRGQALGIYAAGMSTGYAVGSLVGGIAGDSLGYTGAFRLAAVLFLVAMLPMLLDRSEPPPPGRSAAGSAAQPVGWRRATSFAGLLLDPVLMFIILGAFFLNVYLTQFNTFLPLTMLPLGFTLAQIGLVRTAWSLTNTLGRSFGGPVLNWLGHHRAQHSSLVLQAGMLMLLALPLPLPAYIGVTVMAASGRAICFVANTVALADIDPTRVSRGVASGVMNAAGDLGNIAGPVTGGFIARAVGLQSFWLISPPLYLAIYFGLLLALRRREQVQSVPAAV